MHHTFQNDTYTQTTHPQHDYHHCFAYSNSFKLNLQGETLDCDSHNLSNVTLPSSTALAKLRYKLNTFGYLRKGE